MNAARCLVLGGLPLSLVVVLATADSDWGQRSKYIDQIVARSFKADGPGAAVLVVHQGKTVHCKGYGLADLATKSPITPQTAFDLASVAKQFTAMAILILSEKGALTPDDEVRKHVPDFTLKPLGRPVRLRDLLWHVSGLPDYTGEDWKGTPAEFETLTTELHLRWLNTSPARRAPGVKYEYNNSNYALLALVVERVSRKSFAEFAKAEIFQPLGMKNTVVVDRVAQRVPNVATGYIVKNGLAERSVSPCIMTGDGNVFTNILDMTAWDGGLRKHKPVGAKTLALGWQYGTYDDGRAIEVDGHGVGFGWFIQGKGEKQCVFHDGGWAGTATYICRYLTAELTVVVLSNDESADVQKVAIDIAKLYGL